jgi:hypothetical protein
VTPEIINFFSRKYYSNSTRGVSPIRGLPKDRSCELTSSKDEVTVAPPQEDNLSAFETAEFGEDTKDSPVGERQRQTMRLSVNRRDRMLQELM